jgi:hypothetical protein
MQSAVVLASMAWLAASADEMVPRVPPGERTVGRWGMVVGSISTLEPVAGARLRLEGTDHEATTNERGELVLENVTSGRYTLVLEHPEFAPIRRENLQLRPGKLSFVPFWMQPVASR